MKKAFTLVEILIVAAVLGILAAIVLPTFQGHITEARESAAKDNLRILRNAIELYAAQHNGVPPGYPDGDTSAYPYWMVFFNQMLKATNASGQYADVGTPGYPLGPYLSEVPINPFRNHDVMMVILNNEDFPAEAPDTFAWIYKPETKEIRFGWPGTDTKGVRYYDY
jgi:prepilin-type N-terminal cleavage/methylation domain-containing protein